MIRNNSYNFRRMEVYPENMEGTHHIMRYVHDAMYRQFFWSKPPSTDKLFQSFLK